MFICSIKMTRKKIMIGALALVVAITGCCTYFVSTAMSATPTDTKPSFTGKTNEQRKEYIASFGWEIEDDPVEVVEMMVPEQFNESYKNYNELQKEMGLDLEKYKGKRIKRYRYHVLNHPTASGNINASLLVYGDKIIGGDICLDQLDGFTHSLLMPAANQSSVAAKQTTTRTDAEIAAIAPTD